MLQEPGHSGEKCVLSINSGVLALFVRIKIRADFFSRNDCAVVRLNWCDVPVAREEIDKSQRLFIAIA
jgi:hypothetical protein